MNKDVNCSEDCFELVGSELGRMMGPNHQLKLYATHKCKVCGWEFATANDPLPKMSDHVHLKHISML